MKAFKEYSLSRFPSSNNSFAVAKRHGVESPTSPYSNPKRATEAKAWQASPRKASCNWNAQNWYIELLNFDMEVMDNLEIEAY